MKASVLLLPILLASLSSYGRIEASPKFNYNDIRAVRWLDETSQEHNCTTWPVHVGDYIRWVTAYHCVANHETGEPDRDRKFVIDGKPAHLHAFNAPLDLAQLEGGPSAHGYIVALGPPALRDPIWTAGYPFGSKALHVTAGIYSQPKDEDGRAVFNVAAAPGFSGAAVFDDKSGLVIGMIQAIECDPRVGFCVVSRGATVADLRLFLFGEG